MSSDPSTQSAASESSQASSIRAAGDRTIQQYQNWMETNAASHLMRAARQSGITEQLRQHQHTLDQLCQSLSLDPATTRLLLDGLVAIGFVEQYGEDYALARAGHLLCQYDEDLQDRRWGQLLEHLNRTGQPATEQDAATAAGPVTAASPDNTADPEAKLHQHRDHLAATQWIHTSAAIQAAEILDLGGEGEVDPEREGMRILDLGCGSAVWGCAFAHRQGDASVVAVDHAGPLRAARRTAESIGLEPQFQWIEADPRVVTVAEQAFDLVLLAQLLSTYSEADASAVLEKAAAALKPGGRLVAPDLYRGPGKPGLKESLGRLSLHLSTPAGQVRDLRTCQSLFLAAGLDAIQFTYLTASEAGLGMIVAQKPPAE